MQVNAGEFIGKLRDRLAVKLAIDDEPTSIIGGVMMAFDRACVQVLVEELQEKKPELTSGQKAARTRARNRQAREAVSGNPAVVQPTNSVERATEDEHA